jgi:glutaminyl-tRNA synthetase
LYEPLLNEDMADGEDEEAADKKDFISRLNPESLKVLRGYAEKAIAGAETGSCFQFLRTGYFCKDPDSTAALPVYNRTVGLKDTFAKQAK